MSKLRQNQKQRLAKIGGLVFAAAFIVLAVALIVGALSAKWNAGAFSTPAVPLTDFTYEIAGDPNRTDGESGSAAFPYSFQNLAPRTAVTVNTEVAPGQYEYILVKTVYSELRLYADDVLIYACGQPDTYPSWLSDPPTLLKSVPLPSSASRLRFEYLSPSERGAMSVPAPMAGSGGAILAWLFGRNSVLLLLSLVLLVLGLTAVIISLIFGRKTAVFLHLGLFALAVGCWGVGECNATAFIFPYPTLLYLLAFGGLFTLTIPLTRFVLLMLSPQKPFMLKLALTVTEAAVVIAFTLQLTGVAPLLQTMHVFHILIPLGFIVLAATTVSEYFRYRNAVAKRFALPTLILALAAVLEVVNYRLHFTNLLSLSFISGAFVFTLMLGSVSVQYVARIQRAVDELSAKTAFYRRMSHDLRTPLTKVSTNIQTARRRPEEAEELLTKSQDEIMKMAEMIGSALQEVDEGDPGRTGEVCL